MSATEAYSPDFYESIRAGCVSSASVVVPILANVFSVQAAYRVIDVGCGEGHWGKAFQDLGCFVLGVDGSSVDAEIPCFAVDLEQPFADRFLNGGFDVVLCLEVAEHLSPERGPGLVDDLCTLADVVVFSAAIPGQGGVNHINERWPSYWVGLFKERGYECSGAVRWPIWNDDRVEPWYRQNLIVAASSPERFPALFKTPTAPVLNLVHPIIYEARRAK